LGADIYNELRNIMGQILSAWESAIMEALNFADRVKERGAEDLANDIFTADENKDKDGLIEALEAVSEYYEGDEEERIRELASAIAFRVSDPERHHVDYLMDTAEWLPRVPYGLEPYGLVQTQYQHKDGYESKFWTIPGAPISEKYGAILMGFDLLNNQEGNPFVGLRMFFEHIVNNQELTTLLDENGEEIVVPMNEDEDVNVYKCVLSESTPGTVEKAINLIRNALFLDDTLDHLEEAVLQKKILVDFPNAPEIPTELH
jgi:hypothetical protein